MPQLNKEQGVFVGVLLLVVALLFMKMRSMEEARLDRIKPKRIEEVDWNLPEIRVVDRDGAIWSYDRRDVFAIPKEVVDLPPVEMVLPPIPERPIVSPPLDLRLASDDWHRIAQAIPDSLANGRVIESDDLDLFLDDLERRFEEDRLVERVEEDPTIDPLGRLELIREAIEGRETIDLGEIPESVDHMAVLFSVAGTELDRILADAPEVLRDLYTRATGRAIPVEGEESEEGGVSEEALAAVLEGEGDETTEPVPGKPLDQYDRLVVRGELQYGEILNENPLELLGEESADVDRYMPVSGAVVQFALVNERNGRRIGTTQFRADQIETIELKATLENQIALRKRKLKGDVPGRLALARWCEEQQAWDAAVEQYRAALDQDIAFNRDAAFGLVSVYRKDYRWNDLAALLESLTERGIEDGRLEYERGALLEPFGVDAAAEAALDRCVALDPGIGEAWLLLGDLRYGRGAADEGYEAYRRAERALAADREGVSRAIRGQAMCRVASGDAAEALQTVERGLREVSEFDVRLRLLQAKLQIMEGRYDAARSALLGVDGTTTAERRDAELVRGLLAAREGKFFEARAALERAREIDPIEGFWPDVVLAFANLTTGRREATFDALSTAITLDPDRAYSYYLLGRFYLSTGNLEAALESFRTAYAMVPDVTEILGELGRTLLLADVPKDARIYLEELVRRRPESAEAHALLGVACLADRDYDAARDSVEQALQLSDELPVAMVVKAYLDYREGGEGVYTAIGALDRAAEILSEVEGHPLAAYASAYRREIEDNRSKCRWSDGFNRVQIKRDWEVNQRHGVQVRLTDGRIAFEGTQRPRNEEMTYLEREMEFRQVVRLQARVRAPLSEKERAGISLTVRRKRGEDEMQGGILFGRDARGKLAYRLAERADAGEWVSLDRAWPDDEWVTLTIENHDLEEGHFRLLVNGEEVARELQVRSLRKPRSPVRVGVFGTASIGTTWTLEADDIDVIMIKEER